MWRSAMLLAAALLFGGQEAGASSGHRSLQSIPHLDPKMLKCGRTLPDVDSHTSKEDTIARHPAEDVGTCCTLCEQNLECEFFTFCGVKPAEPAVPGQVPGWVPGQLQAGATPTGHIARIMQSSCGAAATCVLKRTAAGRQQLPAGVVGDMPILSGFPASSKLLPDGDPGMLAGGGLVEEISELFSAVSANNSVYLAAGVVGGVTLTTMCMLLVRVEVRFSSPRHGADAKEGEGEDRDGCCRRSRSRPGLRAKDGYEPIEDLSLPWVTNADGSRGVVGPSASPAGEESV